MITWKDVAPNQPYLYGRLLTTVRPGDDVLDLGAGLATYHHLLKLRGVTLTTVDAHLPYVEQHRKIADYAHHVTIQAFLSEPLYRTYDVAFMIDVIEHLPKDEAVAVLRHLHSTADRSVIFTPQGFMPQDRDAYDLGGEHWQTHRSGWEPEEFESMGYDVEVWRDFHVRPELDRKFDAIYAVR